ncbi:MAG: 2-hydroxyacid dehydrogenase [Planktomarina sp.]
MINVLFAAKPDRFAEYEASLNDAFSAAGLQCDLRTDHSPADVDYIVYAPNSDVQDFTPFTGCKAVLNLWAGVETAVGNATLTQPFARMVDESLTDGMIEWVSGHVLRHHLGMDAHITNPDQIWDDTPPPLAKDRPVTILGLGTLGTAVARTMTAFGFPVTGWSRTKKSVNEVRCCYGDKGLHDALEDAQIVVLLLPDTPATRHTINSDTLAVMPKGAVIINPGRGPLIDDDALIAALNSGHIAHATLDVFTKEPLPKDDAYWSMPNVTVTPHIASATRPDTAADVIAENIRRGEAGEDFLHLVDRSAGY